MEKVTAYAWDWTQVTYKEGLGQCGVRVPALEVDPSIGVNEAIGSLIFLPRDYHDQFA